MTEDNGYSVAGADFGYGDYLTVPSPAAEADIPVLAFLPPQPRATVYLLHGVNEQPRNETGLRALINPGSQIRELAEQYRVAVVAPLVPNRFYLDPPDGVPGARWATAIGDELVSGMERLLPELPPERAARFLCGFSMGGYGAVSLLCRHPHRFHAAASRGGLMDLASGVTDHAWDDAAWPVEVLGSYFDFPARYHHNSCPNLVNRLKGHPGGIVLEVGVRDMIALPSNRRLRKHLLNAEIPHTYTETSDGHVMDAHAQARLFAGLSPWFPPR